MTINEQLHQSKTHKIGLDPACPVCSRLAGIKADLRRCAAQNEADAKDSKHAAAVAGEQRRMLKQLSTIR